MLVQLLNKRSNGLSVVCLQEQPRMCALRFHMNVIHAFDSVCM